MSDPSPEVGRAVATPDEPRAAALAHRHAPVFLQKVHSEFLRADFIARVDFAHPWREIHRNWNAPWERTVDSAVRAAARGAPAAPDTAPFAHALLAHAYYSVVESPSHVFLVYAFYHPQDWDSVNGNPAVTSPTEVQQHVHDLEGCLAIVPKSGDPELDRVEAAVTISHWHFYSFAGWRHLDLGLDVPGPFLVRGRDESLDGPLAATARFAGEPGEPPLRFKLYCESGGHGIHGFRHTWGSGRDIVRYRPSLEIAEEPSANAFLPEDDARFQTVRYRLISMFGADGLWRRRSDPNVFLPRSDGALRFVEMCEGRLRAGRATPPWEWDDPDDRARRGDLALHPARLAATYFRGLGEIDDAYTSNPYRDAAPSSGPPAV